MFLYLFRQEFVIMCCLKTEDAFGLALKSMRMRNAVSQASLAIKCGCDVSSISKLERGLTQPSLHFLLLLAKGLNVPAEDLLKETLKHHPDIRIPT